MESRAGLHAIRPFRSEDAGACVELIGQCFRLDATMPPLVVERMLESQSARLLQEQARFFYIAVCELAEGIVGLGGIEMNEIRLLYVSPSHQGKGIGSALLGHLESMVPAAFFEDIFVYAAAGAAGFYCVRGYEPGGEFIFEVEGGSLPTVFLTKRL
jgi:GNAT superfamily N-acetyltransferase